MRGRVAQKRRMRVRCGRVVLWSYCACRETLHPFFPPVSMRSTRSASHLGKPDWFSVLDAESYVRLMKG